MIAEGDGPDAGAEARTVAALEGRRVVQCDRTGNRAPGGLGPLASSQPGRLVPAPRRRSPRVLSLAEREGISRGLSARLALRAISRGLGRPCCTISREIERNGGPREYRAHLAEARAWARARRPKACKLARNRALRAFVGASSAAVVARADRPHACLRNGSDQSWRVSHETIYRTLFVQSPRRAQA